MNHKYVLWYAGGALLLVLVLAMTGVSLTPWVYLLIALACPLMMMFMMGNTHGGHPRSGSGQSADEDNNRPAGSGSN
jgi:hypothetical protein